MSDIYNEIYKIVQSIPKGKVLTYGLVSHMIGGRMSAQGVGWALKALGSKKRKEEASKHNLDSVPWQRVVNTSGGTSTHKIADIPPGLQQHLLEREGILFDDEGKMELTKYLWVEGASESAKPSSSKAIKPNKQSTAKQTGSRKTAKTLLGIVLGMYLFSGTAYSAFATDATAKTGDKYCGLFKQQLSGTTDNFRVTRASGGLYRFQVHGTYPTAAGGNFGDADCTSKITDNLAVLKQKSWKGEGMWVLFNNDLALIVQTGNPADLDLGNNVNLTGIYRRTASSGTKVKPLLSTFNLKGSHFEKADGTLAFNGTFDEATPFREDRAIVTSRSKKGYIDLNGKLIVPYRFDDAHDFYEGLAAVTIDGKKWGYIDNNGNYKIKPIYDYAWDFSEGYGAVAIGKKFFLIDKTDAKNTDKSWDRIIAPKDGLASFKKGNLWGLINTRGDEVVPAKYAGPLAFKEGLASFQDQYNKQGYIDKTGKEVIAATFDKADDFSEGLASVQTKTLYGFIDKTGAKVIPDQFSEIFGVFSNGKCLVRRAGSPYICAIDKTGKQLLQLPLQIREVSLYGAAESTVICHSLDFNFDSGGHDIALDKNYKPLPAFANKDLKYWSGAGLFVVSGPASAAKTSK